MLILMKAVRIFVTTPTCLGLTEAAVFSVMQRLHAAYHADSNSEFS